MDECELNPAFFPSNACAILTAAHFHQEQWESYTRKYNAKDYAPAEKLRIFRCIPGRNPNDASYEWQSIEHEYKQGKWNFSVFKVWRLIQRS
jgi:hypothetical protein